MIMFIFGIIGLLFIVGVISLLADFENSVFHCILGIIGIISIYAIVAGLMDAIFYGPSFIMEHVESVLLILIFVISLVICVYDDYTLNRKNKFNQVSKNNKRAFLYSLMLPFSGSFYIKENKISLTFTLISIIGVLINIFGLITISDFYMRMLYLIIILLIMWIVSILDIIIIFKYSNFDDSDLKNSNSHFVNKKSYSIVIIILFILFLSANLMVLYDSSPTKHYEGDLFSIDYPKSYVAHDIHDELYDGKVNGAAFEREGDYFCVYHKDANGKTIDDILKLYKSNKNININSKYVHKSNVANTSAYLIENAGVDGDWFIFVKDDIYYKITFFEVTSEETRNLVLNTFEFK